MSFMYRFKISIGFFCYVKCVHICSKSYGFVLILSFNKTQNCSFPIPVYNFYIVLIQMINYECSGFIYVKTRFRNFMEFSSQVFYQTFIFFYTLVYNYHTITSSSIISLHYNRKRKRKSMVNILLIIPPQTYILDYANTFIVYKHFLCIPLANIYNILTTFTCKSLISIDTGYSRC